MKDAANKNKNEKPGQEMFSLEDQHRWNSMIILLTQGKTDTAEQIHPWLI